MSEAWIETYTGIKFPLLEPQPELVCIEDIAHALSQQCRWTGHTKRFYSVAEHSMQTAWNCKPEDALAGLLHDASEAYMSDFSRPIKHCTPLGPVYREIEVRLQNAVFARFGLPDGIPVSVKEADNWLLWIEKQQLMSDVPWDAPEAWDAVAKSRSQAPVLQCWTPLEAEERFLVVFETLTESR